MAGSLWRGATCDKKGCRHRSEFVCDQARDVPPKAVAQAIAESRLPFDRRALAPPRLMIARARRAGSEKHNWWLPGTRTRRNSPSFSDSGRAAARYPRYSFASCISAGLVFSSIVSLNVLSGCGLRVTQARWGQFEDGIVGRQIGNGRTTEPSPCSAAIASNGPR
jgi:hypothetical protein